MCSQRIYGFTNLLRAGSLAILLVPTLAVAQQLPVEGRRFPNATGLEATFSGASASGEIDLSHSFFQPIAQQLGGNDRSCASCHRPEQGWSITPVKLQALFDLTSGLDPIFLPVDGTNASNSDVSTLEARRQASSLLLNKGLIRVERPILSSFEFDLVAVTVPPNGSFPPDFVETALTNQIVSVFRRPPPTGNLNFATDLMWDGREAPPNTTLNNRLLSQALGAARGHMQGNLPGSIDGLSTEQLQLLQSIVDFERSIFLAQGQDVSDLGAGVLDDRGAFGGPLVLMTQPPQLFEGGAFNLFSSWNQLAADPLDPDFLQVMAKNSVARGETLFNSRVFQSGIIGQVTCATCHGVAANGNSTTARRFNLGLSVPGISLTGVRVNDDFPVYTLRRKSTGQLIRSTDPGRILVDGIWGGGVGDAFKVPALRGLASRPPYFHGGQARDLTVLVNFYNNRFGIGLTPAERADMVAFLRSL